MSSKRRTQAERIIHHCELFGHITVRQAFEIYGINSPTKRISEISRDPRYDVSWKWEESENRFGEKITYKRYFIRKKEQE